MSRTLLIVILGAALVAGVLGIAVLVFARGFLMIADQGIIAETPPLVLQETAIATESPSTATATVEATTAVLTATPSPPVPAPATPTAISVLTTDVQYALALTDVNMRSGPGTGYGVVGWLAAGQIAWVTGISGDNGWWRVACPDGAVGDCWITAAPRYTEPTTAPGSNPTPTAPAACSDSAALVADVTVPDGSQFAPNTGFNKTWRIRNTGTCTWDHRYKLVHAGGHLLGTISTGFPLPGTVAPGQTVDLTVSLISPTTPDTYQSDWKLQDPQGRPFGVGRNDGPFWVRIAVSSGQLTTIYGVIYEDGNQNSVYDSDEMLVANREVWLIPGDACDVRREPVAKSVSGGNGFYILSGNFGGNYCVGLAGAAGLDDVASVSVTTGQALSSINLRSPLAHGSIGGYLWNDFCLAIDSGQAVDGNCVADASGGGYHADGMLQATEGIISGVTVLLQVGPCATGNQRAVTAVTDTAGRYFFGALRPGTYCVSMNAASPSNAPLLLPGDWTFPARGIWYQEIVLRAGENAFPVNFGWDYQLR